MKRSTNWSNSILLACVWSASAGAGPLDAQNLNDPTLIGAWDAVTYRLADGPEHVVRGHIFFTERDWTVLFFVMDGEGTDGVGEPGRGSAEGGTYSLAADQLVFTHLYHLSVGEEMEGLPESSLRMEVRREGSGGLEESTISVDGGALTIFFPSGNSMSFRRRS